MISGRWPAPEEETRISEARGWFSGIPNTIGSLDTVSITFPEH
jgi:hypothetical protein